MTDKLLGLKEELVELENKEMELDQHFSWAKQSIFNITDDPFNKSVSYVKHEDFLNAFPNKTVLVLQGPPGTQLEVSNPIEKDDKRNYQIHLKSKNGPINVLYVNSEVNAEEFNNENEQPINDADIMEVDDCSENEIEIVKEDLISNRELERTPNHDDNRATKKLKLNDKTAVEKATTNDTSKNATPTNQSDSVRRLSPRKAAQKHLFVQYKSANQPDKSATEAKKATTTPNTKTTPLNRRNSTSTIKQLTNSTSKVNDKGADENEVSNDIENSKPVQKQQTVKRNSKLNSKILNEENIRPDVQQPLLRLSPPSSSDYCFNLDACEGALDLFDSHVLVEQQNK